MNWQVLLFTVALAVLTALLFSSVPAWRAAQVDLHESLKAAARSASRGLTARPAGKALVVAEVMFSLVLLTGAGLLIKSVVLFASVPLGFSTKNVLCVPVELHLRRYDKPEQREIFYNKVLRNVADLPGITGVALTTFYPLAGGGQSATFEIKRQHGITGSNEVQTLHQAISPSYLEVMKTPLLKGRNFDGRDRRESEPVALINQKLAQQYFPGRSAVGEHIRLNESNDTSPWIAIVGIVGDQRKSDFFHEMNWADSPIVFRPVSQAEPRAVSVFVRTVDNPERLQLAVQKQILTIDGNVPVGTPETLEQRFAKALAYPRFRALLLGVFAGMALLLASVGLYGVLAQLVSQRTQEIGIRMALGAQKADVLLLIVREGMTLAVAGVIIGLIAACLLQQFIRTLLYRTETNDIATMMGVSLLLLLSAFLAVYLPARRAARLDPTVTLRYE